MKKFLVVLLVAFIIIQFFPIDKSNPPIDKGMDFLSIKNTPEPIAKIITTSCYDCHSNESKYPWYSNIAPASWLLQNHIKEGRKHLNFSTFAMYEPKRQIKKMEECVEMIEKNEMPLESYFIGHQDAKITEVQRQDLIKYFKRSIEDTEIKMR
ncbi:heme-binding domain-containing protein [Chryseobacterium sp.]|uniref:heme-binding domain-containing protein n=1 Tax=Chryseobacterium sp. TaxID=1871047 RepID=UPI00388F2A8B